MASAAVMGLGAYGFSRLTRTDWVWWLAPLTVALDGSLLFRAQAPGGPALFSIAELPLFRDSGVSSYLVSSLLTTGVAVWGVYTGNRLALLIGAAFAILGVGLERGEAQ